jgi:hypothetical protein
MTYDNKTGDKYHYFNKAHPQCHCVKTTKARTMPGLCCFVYFFNVRT